MAAPETLVLRVLYGESYATPEAQHLRGRACLTFDGAGLLEAADYDFKGNLLFRDHGFISMNDEDIVKVLQIKRIELSPVELAQLLDNLAEGGLSQSALVSYFRRAFPAIPLRTLLDAGAWERVSNGGMTDQEFNELLQPWIGTK